jgi:hypothetical protein
VQHVNRFLRGWVEYFKYGHSAERARTAVVTGLAPVGLGVVALPLGAHGRGAVMSAEDVVQSVVDGVGRGPVPGEPPGKLEAAREVRGLSEAGHRPADPGAGVGCALVTVLCRPGGALVLRR